MPARMNITELLIEKRITGYRLSRESGVPQTTITDICSGKTQLSRCSAETVYRIARVLGVSMESLVEPYVGDAAGGGLGAYKAGELPLTRENLSRLADESMKNNVLKLFDGGDGVKDRDNTQAGAQSGAIDGSCGARGNSEESAELPPALKSAISGLPREDSALRDSLFSTPFDRRSLDRLLSLIAKSYRDKAGDSAPTELILTGGAALLTACASCAPQYDIGVATLNSPPLDSAVESVCKQLAVDRAQLAVGTSDGRPLSLEAVISSRYCKTFSGVVSVRRLSGEYICAMRLLRLSSLADVGDTARAMLEASVKNRAIKPQRVTEAAGELGGTLSDRARAILNALCECGDLAAVARELEGKR